MKHLSLAFAALTVAILSACANTAPSSTPPVTAGCKTWDSQAGNANLAGVGILSSDLAKMIGVQEVFIGRSALGMANVNTSVYNCTEVDVVLLFRARFSGDRGETEAPSAWRTVFLPPRGMVSYGETAISPLTSRVSVDIADGNRGQSQFAPGQTYTVPKDSVK